MIVVLAPVMNFVLFNRKKNIFILSIFGIRSFLAYSVHAGSVFFYKLCKKYNLKKLIKGIIYLLIIASKLCPFNRSRGGFLAHFVSKCKSYSAYSLQN
jgi:hypothetical protein